LFRYPVDIAQGTAVPHWAYYNVTSSPNETWSQTVAISVGPDPEATPKAINTATSSVSGHSTITKTSSGNGSGPTSDTNTKGGTNVAAIVGGVVGTVVPLTILAIVAFLWTRRRRQQTQQPQMVPMPMPDDDPYKQRPISYGTPPITNFTPYDPSNPATFPPQSPPSSVTYTTQPNNLRGAYSGVPEV